MEKVQKPKGLIRYKATTSQPIQWFRSRVIGYSVLLLASLGGLAFALAGSKEIRVELLRGKDIPFQVRQGENGETLVQNHFKLRIENQRSIVLGPLNVQSNTPNLLLTVPLQHFELKASETLEVPIFIEAPNKYFERGYFAFEIQISTEDGKVLLVKKNLQLVGPSY